MFKYPTGRLSFFFAQMVKNGHYDKGKMLILSNQFWPILTPHVLKIENFGPNLSLRAEKLATTIFVWEIRKKLVPSRSANPQNSNSGGFCCLLKTKYWLHFITSPVKRVINVKEMPWSVFLGDLVPVRKSKNRIFYV